MITNPPVMLFDRESPYPAVIIGDGPDAEAAAMQYAAMLLGYMDAIRAQSAARNRRERRFTRASQAAR